MLTVRVLELQSALISLLNARNKEEIFPKNCVYLMRPNLIDHLFQLKVGNERVSLYKIVDFPTITQPEHKCFDGVNLVDVHPDPEMAHLPKPEMRVIKEHLGAVLLVTVGFNYLLTNCY